MYISKPIIAAVVFALAIMASIRVLSQPTQVDCSFEAGAQVAIHDGFVTVTAPVHYPKVDNLTGEAIGQHAIFGCFEGNLVYVYHRGEQFYLVVSTDHRSDIGLVSSDPENPAIVSFVQSDRQKLVYVPVPSAWTFDFPNGMPIVIDDTRTGTFGWGYFVDGNVTISE